MGAHEEWVQFFEDLPYGTFCKMCDQIDELRAETSRLIDENTTINNELVRQLRENDRLRDFNQRLMAELAQHGWGDFHYGDQPQDPAIVRLLKEGNFGHVYSNTEAPSTDATPSDESDRGTGERQDPVGWGWDGQNENDPWLLLGKREPG